MRAIYGKEQTPAVDFTALYFENSRSATVYTRSVNFKKNIFKKILIFAPEIKRPGVRIGVTHKEVFIWFFGVIQVGRNVWPVFFCPCAT